MNYIKILLIILLVFSTSNLYAIKHKDLPVEQCHDLDADKIVAGDINREYGGLGEDVSSYNGAVKISSGSTSCVAIATQATGSLVTVGDTLRLYNKGLSDSLVWFYDVSDTTKKVYFNLSDLTTANSRIITLLDEDFTVVGVASTQTLTNKRLTSPKINEDVAVTATATEINNTVDSVSVFSARSLSNKDTLDTYINGITYSKDLFDTGVTVTELDILDGVTANKNDLNTTKRTRANGLLEPGIVIVPDANGFMDTTKVYVVYFNNAETIDNSQDGALFYNAEQNVFNGSICFPKVTGGTADSINLDFSPNITALAVGLTVRFLADSSNTGAATIVIDALAEKAIIEAHDLSALEANDIRQSMIVELVYDGKQWQQISQSGN